MSISRLRSPAPWILKKGKSWNGPSKLAGNSSSNGRSKEKNPNKTKNRLLFLMNSPSIVSNLISFQPELRPALPTIEGSVDYQQLRTQLERIDEILTEGGVEQHFVKLSFEHWGKQGKEPLAKVSIKQKQIFEIHSIQALRCDIARTLSGEDFRGMNCRIADSALLQWFCLVGQVDKVKVPSKSTLHRYAQWLPEESIREIIHHLLGRACEPGQAGEQALKLEEPLDLDGYFLDTTCVKANIHFPVDWVLLRDGTRTLLKAIIVIRKHGLRHRIEAPETFLKRMNRLCIEMTHTGRKVHSKKERKRILRQMKKLVKVVGGHARGYRKLLDACWEQSDLTRGQAEQILRRIDGVLELLPGAQKQAHERIIGERLVPNEEKILSLYEPQIRVIVRGKVGAEVEFGNVLLLGENPQGVIVDWKLHEQSPSDVNLVQESIQRVEEALSIRIQEIGADRGFESKTNRRWLEKRSIYNGICPRDPRVLKERMEENRFRELQKRRAQTEGRIAIFKNEFLGRPMRSKGFGHRKLQIAWGILTHNLWVIARLPQAAQQELQEAA